MKSLSLALLPLILSVSTAQAAVLAAQGAQSLAFQGLNGGIMFHPGSARHGVDGPSTPTSHPAGLATTPGPSGHGMMTPGGSGYGGYGK